MNDPAPIVCPQCGQETFKSNTKLRSKDDFIGSVCSECSHKITKLEFENQLKKIAAEHLRKILRK